jgi:hypothetical protein
MSDSQKVAQLGNKNGANQPNSIILENLTTIKN